MGDYLPSTELANVRERIQEAAKIFAMNTQSKGNSFPLRPSSALKSDRDLYYGLVNYFKPGTIPVDPVEGRNAMLLSLGHAIETHFVEHIGRAFAVGNRNMRVTYGQVTMPDGTQYNLGGEFDFTITSTKTGETVIADSKSSAAFPFKGDLPKDDHIAQINLYLHSDWARERGINKAWIMYYCKNDSDIRIFEFAYNKEAAEAVIARFQAVLDSYKKGELPKRVHVLGSDWQAAYSSYRTYDNRSFLTPRHLRTVVKGELDEELDSKGLVKRIAIEYDNQVVEANGRRYWLELGTTTLILKKEKI
jgi:hypothetical protein